jgi:6-phosphofructokinase 1
VVLRGGIITTISMLECAGRVKSVPADDEMVRSARGLGISFGDEEISEFVPEPLTELSTHRSDTATNDAAED